MSPVPAGRLRAAVVALAPVTALLLGAVLPASAALPQTPTSTSTSTTLAGATPEGPPEPEVRGERLVDARTGSTLHVAGLNRPGTEYACVQGWGFFDGPTDAAAIQSMLAWGVNTVRLPLNETCWLGINGVGPRWSGESYRAAVEGFVARLHDAGLAVVLDLHWSHHGSTRATAQEPAPNADHSIDFWSSVATRFADDPSVMFELFNEPHDISWTCWRDGCTTAEGWRAAGMQELVDAVRSVGATQPLIVTGLLWGGDLERWSQFRPTDPQGQVVAGWHVYNFSGCSTASCWDATAAPVAEEVPVLLTEVGQDGCGRDFLDRILPWADEHGIGYLAWSWSTADCSSMPALISDWQGTPTAYGAGYREHLEARTLPDDDAGAPPTEPGGTPVPVDPTALQTFESGTHGWKARWGSIGVSSWAGTARSGTGALALDLSGAGWPAAGFGVGSQGLSGQVRGGSEVTMRVWAPDRGDGTAPVSVSPMTFDPSWRAWVGGAVTLQAGAWTTVRFTVPDAGAIIAGLQVNNGSGWTGRIYVDDVDAVAPRLTFDTGTEGFSTRWGSATVGRRTTDTWAGAGALTVRPGTGYPAVGTASVTDLDPGDDVVLHVHVPAGTGTAAPRVQPMWFDGTWAAGTGPSTRLEDGWNTVRFTVPASLDRVRIVGLQVNNGGGWSGTLGVDQVSW